MSDSEVNDSVLPPEYASIKVDDIARRCGTWPRALDHFGIMPTGHEADVLAVMLFRDRQTETPRQLARLRLGLVTKRKTQMFELGLGRCEQEVALVALRLARPKQRAPAAGKRTRGDVMTGRKHARAKIASGFQKVAKLDRLITLQAGHWRLSGKIAVGETVDYGFLEALFVVEDVMRNADPLRHGAGVMDVAAGAAGALAVGRGAVIVKLQRDPDDIVAGVRQ